jgi:hypothetical protein
MTPVSWRNMLSWINPSFNRQRVLHCVGEGFADVSIVNRVPDGDGGVMVWEGIIYSQQTQLHFIDADFVTF